MDHNGQDQIYRLVEVQSDEHSIEIMFLQQRIIIKHANFSGISIVFKVAKIVFHRYFQYVSNIFKNVTKMFKDCFTGVEKDFKQAQNLCRICMS